MPESLPPDRIVVDRLLAGDEATFSAVVEHYSPSMLRVAKHFCGRYGGVDEVVQETWLAVLEGLPRFEGRSSFKTWLFRILTNRAKTRGKKEARSVPLSAVADDAHLHPERFAADGHWSSPPDPWTRTPDVRGDNAELREMIMAAISELPERQRQVIVFRDVEGLSSQEVCSILVLNDTHQRVLLHRARNRVRDLLADYLAGTR